MSCNCHGKSGISIKFISPYDQCTNCAKKHIIKAWQLFNEFNYLELDYEFAEYKIKKLVLKKQAKPAPMSRA